MLAFEFNHALWLHDVALAKYISPAVNVTPVSHGEGGTIAGHYRFDLEAHDGREEPLQQLRGVHADAMA